MKYEHQINCTKVYTDKLDDTVVGQAQKGSNDLISIRTSPLSERMANSEGCTSYDHKNQINSYDFLRIIRVDALLLSVSFKPIFVDFTLVIDMLLTIYAISHVPFFLQLATSYFALKKDYGKNLNVTREHCGQEVQLLKEIERILKG